MPLCPVYYHPASLDHLIAPKHPESPARLRAVLDRIRARDPGAIREAPRASREAVRRVHPDEYLDRLHAVAEQGGGQLDADTGMNGASWEAALGAVGAVLAAVDSALGGRPAFAAVRPPGHHALAGRAMGFCLLANVVIGARAVQARGVERVLIVDWDVHHGNGTQALVENDPSIRFVSLHQWPHWPFSGSRDEKGVGNVFNVPMRAGLDPDRYVEGLWQAVERATTGWTPGAILISAGFDSMRGDLLGGFTLEPEHYGLWVDRLRNRFQDAPIAAAMEGGYVPYRLAEGVETVAEALGH
ncbi:MAG: histone deacetylase [Gemmatimonadales bacterium]